MKLFFKLLFGLIFLAIAGVVVFVMTFDLNRYRDLIAEKASIALNRQVKITSLELKLSLVPTVLAKGIEIANPKGFDATEPLAKINSAEVTLALVPLIQQRIQINDFRMGSATFNLVNKNGENNWTFGTASTARKSKSTKPTTGKSAANNLPAVLSQLNIDSIQLQKLVVSYEKDGQKQQVQLTDLVLKQLKAVSFVLMYEGNTVKVSGTMNDLLDLIRKKPDYVFNMTIDALGGTAKVSGKIGDTGDWSNILLDFELKTNNLSRTLSYLKIQNKMIPTQSVTLKGIVKGDLNTVRLEPLTLSVHHDGFLVNLSGKIESLSTAPTATLKGNISLTDIGLAAMYGVRPLEADIVVTTADKKVTISSLNLTANKSDVHMNAVISLAEEVPVVTAQITSTYFNPKDLMYEDTTATPSSTKTKKAGAVFSDSRIDMSGLKSANGVVSVKMEHMEVIPDILKGYLGVAAQATLKDGVLTLNPLRLNALNGVVQGQIVVDAAAATPQISAQLTGDNLVLDQVKSMTDLVQGSVLNAEIDLKTSGSSVKSFVNALDGNAVLEVSEGKIVNKWFNTLPMAVGLIQMKKSFSYSTTDQESKLNCVALNLNVNKGVVEMDRSVAIETSLLNFSVSGTVNLPRETLSVSMVPSVSQLSGATNQKLAITQIVKVSGPFKNPSVHIDAKDTIKNVAQKGLEQLAGKLVEKAGGQVDTATPAEPTNLCEIALGRKPKGKVQAVVAPRVVPQQTKTDIKKVVQEPETFKDEFLKSLSEAIKK